MCAAGPGRNPLPRKRGRVGVGVFTQRIGNFLQHARWVAENLIVPEAKDAPPLRAQPRIAPLMIAEAGMLATINLDN